MAPGSLQREQLILRVIPAVWLSFVQGKAAVGAQLHSRDRVLGAEPHADRGPATRIDETWVWSIPFRENQETEEKQRPRGGRVKPLESSS